MCTNFKTTQTTLYFLAQIWPKMDFGVETSFIENKQLWIFWLKFAQKWILELEFQKCKCRFGISILELLGGPIFRVKGQFWTFGPKFAQKWILGLNLKNLSVQLELASLRYHVHQFSHKVDKFKFFALNLPKIDFRVGISKREVLIPNQHPWDTMCTNFQTKGTILNFWA